MDKHGDSPTYAFYGDDDEAFQKVASGFKADVIHPCSQMVGKYRDAGLIEPWDTSRIPNFEQIEERFLEQRGLPRRPGRVVHPDRLGRDRHRL